MIRAHNLFKICLCAYLRQFHYSVHSIKHMEFFAKSSIYKSLAMHYKNSANDRQCCRKAINNVCVELITCVHLMGQICIRYPPVASCVWLRYVTGKDMYFLSYTDFCCCTVPIRTEDKYMINNVLWRSQIICVQSFKCSVLSYGMNEIEREIYRILTSMISTRYLKKI